MKGETIIAESWPHLQEILYTDSWNEPLSRFRSSYVYRGLEDSQFTLTTTLNRLGESHLEKHLLRNFRKYSQKQISSEYTSLWNWLALAQHHGLPTRLLDWTYSPYVALHFTTADFTKYKRDGMIWAINYVDSKAYLPDQLARIIEAEGSHIFTAEMLDRVVDDLAELRHLKKDDFAIFFEPPSIDDRIVNQYAVFSMMSNPNLLISDWVDSNEVSYFKIIIPAHLKWEIRDKLDQSNINERVLFPGLDGLATWLKRHYRDMRLENLPIIRTASPDDEEKPSEGG
ncbi:MAG: FRG domain-containing protein [Phaeodactylibacter sp.]|nr:FRG domain-containing protein [Phaeodactylibacter sp.]MCB9274110.1 FRG domain-containing protein [Lewinellaceae bacterium]